MTDRPKRVVDAHIHLWDPANTQWYPYLSRPPEGGGDPSRMFRSFDVQTYRSESKAWNVEKFVNVAAATGLNSIEETIELDRTAEANGGPHGIIGGLPPADSVTEALAFLDQQMAAPLFRGVRPMGAKRDLVPDPEILRALRDRDLVFDLMAFAGELRPAAEALAQAQARVDGPQIVIEHTGWPQSGSDQEFAIWKEGMRALADLGPHVACKLSGLAMPLQTMDQGALAPWIEFAIETFGPDRCLFASNFPVDATYGTYDDLYETFNALTAGLGDAARDQLFAGTAERIYRL